MRDADQPGAFVDQPRQREETGARAVQVHPVSDSGGVSPQGLKIHAPHAARLVVLK
jgi:hypothetical protein